MTGWIVLAVVAFITVMLLITAITIVQEKSNNVIERLGSYNRVLKPGFHMIIPFFEWTRATVNMRVQELDVAVETKTKDNVFVDMKISVQFKVRAEKVYEACYILDDTSDQINSYVFDVVRATVPKMELDDVFVNKEEIAKDIQGELEQVMGEYGYDIVKALVTDINPAENVKEAMNRINAAEREKSAALAEGEAHKIKVVKVAEAEAESKKLQGKGIADQRIAIAEGFKKSIDEMKEGVGENVTGEDIMNVLLMVQHFDTMKDVAGSSQTNTLFLNNSPSGLSDLRQQMLEAIVSSKKV